MTWVKLDDQFPDHPKIEAAGPLAAWLFVCGLCYAAEHLTDGFIPATKAARLTTIPRPNQHIATLLRVGLWEQVDDGYTIPGYLEYQPSKAKVTAEREAAKRRMAQNRSGEVPPNMEGTSDAPSFPRPSDVGKSSPPLTVVGGSAEERVYAVIAEQAVKNARNVADVDAYRKRCLATARTKHGEQVRSLLEQFDAPPDVVAAAVVAGETHSLNHFRRRPA